MLVWEQNGRRDRRCGWRWAAAIPLLAMGSAALLAAGCASPGPPRAPSLQLPATVSDLVATRRGDAVELQFAVPTRTSEGLAYRGASMRATVCRAVDEGSCLPVAALTGVSVTESASGTGGPQGAASGAAGATKPLARLDDALPVALAAGPVRLLTYRVELMNMVGRTAGFGDAAYAAAGSGPRAVVGLRAQGSRAGVELRWQPEAAASRAEAQPGGRGSEVVLRRERVSGSSGGAEAKQSKNAKGPAKAGTKRAEPGVVWLSTTPLGDPLKASGPEDGAANEAPERLAAAGANGAIDDSAAVNSTYRYAAERQHTVQMGGHTLVLHSGLSAPVEVTLRAVYPPPAPTDLMGTLFPLVTVDDPASEGTQKAGLAVDLIWTPPDDPGVVGYNVTREVVHSGEAGISSRTRLTKAPVRVPAFHDVLPPDLVEAAGRVEFQYSVTAVDARGMESSAAVTVVGASGR